LAIVQNLLRACLFYPFTRTANFGLPCDLFGLPKAPSGLTLISKGIDHAMTEYAYGKTWQSGDEMSV